jgi:hypothetical protein
MANHKYKNTSNQRAGCKLCKPWKVNGNHNNGWTTKRPTSDIRVTQESLEDLKQEFHDYDHDYYHNECYADCCFDSSRLKFLEDYNVK